MFLTILLIIVFLSIIFKGDQVAYLLIKLAAFCENTFKSIKKRNTK